MAIEPKITDLINAEIDGKISTEDQAVLDQHLRENAEAKALHNELSRLCGELDSMDEVTPPADIRRAVMEQVGQSAQPVRIPVKRGWQVALNEFLGIAAVRYTMSFAAGVILTFVLVSSDQISRQAFDDVTGLVGTMTDPGSTSAATEVDSMALTLNELAGSVSLNRAGSLMILDFDLASQSQIEIVAQFDDRDIWFNGFAQLESAGTSVAAQTGQVTIQMEGQRRYAVYLHNTGRNAATVNLQFFSAGQLLYEGEMRFREGN
jgi:predicted anti-sigma-YlaC factor YlaD